MDTDEDGLLTEKELMDGMRDAGYNLSRDQPRSSATTSTRTATARSTSRSSFRCSSFNILGIHPKVPPLRILTEGSSFEEFVEVFQH